MAAEAQNNAPNQTLNIPPEVAGRLRSRRPGYDRIAELWQEYEELPAEKQSQLSPNELLRSFVRPMFGALGWKVESMTLHSEKRPRQSSPFILAINDFPVVAEFSPLSGPLSSERDADYQLRQWAESNSTPYGLLTNFEAIRIWDYSDPNPHLILETGPRQYLTDESPEVDLLAAEVFYERLARPSEPAQKREVPPTEQMQREAAQPSTTHLEWPQEAELPATEQMQQEAIQAPVEEAESIAQTDIPTEAPEAVKVSEVETEEEETPPLPNLVDPYGQPDGPQQRYEEVMAGISFGSQGAPARTISALATDRQSGQAVLLLAGGTLPEGAEVFQPAPEQGGGPEDEIGVVIRAVFNERCLGAVARPDSERPFLTTLPNQKAIGGITTPHEGLEVCKFGGGSGYTQGRIGEVGRRVNLVDDFERTIRLSDAFLIQDPDFSTSGDVGPLVLTVDTFQAVGVIVGHQDGNTVCLPIQPILDRLQVELIPEPVRYRYSQRPTQNIAAATDLAVGQDRLGFEEYATAFVRLIKDTTPPLTIGIYGAWGTGKSFLMNMIQRRLGQSEPNILVVEFKAWDYNANEKLWAGLVKQIFGRVEKKLGWYGQLRLSLEPTLERQWRKLRSRLLPYTLIIMAIGLLVIFFALANQDTLAAWLTGATALGFVLEVGRQIYQIFSTPASQRIVDLFATADYRQDIDFMERIRDDLQTMARKLPEPMKVVVFIDDLDRCEPAKAVEVIEAVKLLLDFERFIVFMAIDARIITQAVEEHYGKILTEAEITGYEYLDKIVQIPFSIPEPPPNDLRQYLGSLVNMEDVPPLEIPAPPTEAAEAPPELIAEPLAPESTEPEKPAATEAPQMPEKAGEAEPPPSQSETPVDRPEPPPDSQEEEIAEELEERIESSEVLFTRQEQEAFLGFYAHLDPNPRRLKRLVNIYRLVRTLIAGHRQSLTADGLAGVSANTPNDAHIMAWLIICEQWPYAAHVMLEIMDESYKRAETNPQTRRTLATTPLTELHRAAQQRIAREENQPLQKLDLKYEQLESFIGQHLRDFTLADLRRLKPFTVNFNPALSAEVRLTLSKAGAR